MQTEKKYYIVNSIDMARCLVWVTGQNYYKFDSLHSKEGKVYSFINTLELQEALKDINDLRSKYHD